MPQENKKIEPPALPPMFKPPFGGLPLDKFFELFKKFHGVDAKNQPSASPPVDGTDAPNHGLPNATLASYKPGGKGRV